MSAKLTAVPSPTAPTPITAARDAVATWSTAWDASFPERADVRDALLDAYIARAHVLLLGPPGTAKTTCVRAFASAVGSRSFYVQLHRQLPVEEIFGPLDVREFQSGRYVRRLSDYAADAEVVVLDEVFKAGPTVLNPLLTFLTDRTVKQDGREHRTPLVTAVGVSNELPSPDDDLSAMHDRFPLRVWVDNIVDDTAWGAMVAGELPPLSSVIAPEHVRAIADVAAALPVDASARTSLRTIISDARARGVAVSDRRSARAMDLMRVRAARQGAQSVTASHVGVLELVCWNTKEEIPIVRELVRKHAAPWLRDVQDASSVLDEIKARLAATMRAKQSREQQGSAIVAMNVQLQDLSADMVPRIAAHGADAALAAAELKSRIGALAREVIQAGARLGIMSAPA